jgi:hypothetical protein
MKYVPSIKNIDPPLKKCLNFLQPLTILKCIKNSARLNLLLLIVVNKYSAINLDD